VPLWEQSMTFNESNTVEAYIRDRLTGRMRNSGRMVVREAPLGWQGGTGFQPVTVDVGTGRSCAG